MKLENPGLNGKILCKIAYFIDDCLIQTSMFLAKLTRRECLGSPVRALWRISVFWVTTVPPTTGIQHISVTLVEKTAMK